MPTETPFSVVDGLATLITDNPMRLLLRLFRFTTLVPFVGKVASADSGNATIALGPSAFTVPGVFPTSVYRHYYNSPTATSAQVQPVISDPITVCSKLRNQRGEKQ